MNTKELSSVLWEIATNYSIDLTTNYIEFIQKRLENKGITIEQVKYAANRIIEGKTKAYEKMPTFGEFLEVLEGNPDQKAEIAAQNVIALVRSVGAYDKPALDPVSEAVINSRFGGWKTMCGQLEETKLQWFIREFKEAYSAYSAGSRLMLPDKQESENVLKQIGGDVLKTITGSN